MSITRGIIVTSPRPSEWVKKSRPTYRVPGVAASVGHPDVGSGARRGPLLAAARPASVLAALLPPLLVTLVAAAQRLAHALQALEPVGELVGHLARLFARADDVGGDEDEQLHPVGDVAVRAEGPAEDRDVHEVRDARPGVGHRVH